MKRGSLKRIRFVLAVLYWSIRHRSLSLGRWIAAYEGLSWN
jgi:hypothetical protein